MISNTLIQLKRHNLSKCCYDWKYIEATIQNVVFTHEFEKCGKINCIETLTVQQIFEQVFCKMKCNIVLVLMCQMSKIIHLTGAIFWSSF